MEEHLRIGIDLLIAKLHEWFQIDNENIDRKAICKIYKKILKELKNAFRKQLQIFPGNFKFSALLNKNLPINKKEAADPFKLKIKRKFFLKINNNYVRVNKSLLSKYYLLT